MTPIERIARAGYEVRREHSISTASLSWDNAGSVVRAAWIAAARAIIAQTVKELDADDR